MAEKFYTDGMTVNEILNMSTQELTSLSQRDISRALRTVSLAANKRIDRLVNNSVKTKDGYAAKPGKTIISTKALNWATNDGAKVAKFGVKQAKVRKGQKSPDRNAMLQEFSRVRQFMQMQTSTIKGAEQVRKNSDLMLLGKTREELIKEQLKQVKGMSKADKAALKQDLTNTFAEYEKEVYSRYRKFMELHPEWDKPGYESSTIIKSIANTTYNGYLQDISFSKALDDVNEAYIEHISQYGDIEDTGLTL